VNESLLKAIILCKGVRFTDRALEWAKTTNAKPQNLVYNLPAGAEEKRPQEMFLVGLDGYSTVVSTVVPHDHSDCIEVDYKYSRLVAHYQGTDIDTVAIRYVKKPSYYRSVLANGLSITRLISSCGADELNIWPWHDCAIEKPCRFCGAHKISRMAKHSDPLYAYQLSRDPSLWAREKETFLAELEKAFSLAIRDRCFDDHMHVILISGNLTNNCLDLQANIFCDIASTIFPLIPDKAQEGIVAVCAPPQTLTYLDSMKTSGISSVIFNMEVGTPAAFQTFCPGKAAIGWDHHLQALKAAVPVFGMGQVWSNFVLGLEPVEDLMGFCEYLLTHGVLPTVNILHLDEGSTMGLLPPDLKKTIWFFRRLSQLYYQCGKKPLYCAKALRTSLVHEAFDGRFKGNTYND